MKTQHLTYLSLGTNEGEKLQNLQKAIDKIADRIGIIQKTASVYKTPAWGFDGNDFYNTCIKVSTYLPSDALILELLEVEIALGRQRKNTKGYANRVIDILLFDNEIINTENLAIPYPKMLERKFVLAPLSEISNVTHPITKTTIQHCLINCKDVSEITIIPNQL